MTYDSSNHFGRHKQFCITASLLATNTPITVPHHICPSGVNSTSSIFPYITQQLTTCTVNGNNAHQQLYFELVEIGHNQLQYDRTGHRPWEAVIAFSSSDSVKMTSIVRNNLIKSCQLHRWSRNSFCFQILDVHYKIHKPLSFNLKSNQVKMELNIIIPAMLKSLN